MSTVHDEIAGLFAGAGAQSYFGEAVSTAEHGLQAAHLARTEGASPALIVAALLHDIGHLIDDVPGELAQWTADARHEERGSEWLAQRFGRIVSEPVRLHVSAKRYLCATDPGYFARLSEASVATLRLQGGPMTAAETRRFKSETYCREALLIRRCDDRAKVVGFAAPSLEHHAELIRALARAGHR